MKLIHICNPANRRAGYLREAASKLGLTAPREVAWQDLLTHGAELNPQAGDVIRIESPGEDFEVERLLVEKGGGPNGLCYERGRLRNQVEWYCGWKQTLSEIRKAGKKAAFINSPEEIELMFHKNKAQEHLENHGVPVPPRLGIVESFDQLKALLENISVRRVFLKPCHSSSASGVVALQMASADRMIATTSAEVIDTRIYNSLRLRRYQDAGQVRRLVDLLGRENLMVERWFPKASFWGRVYDLRVLVIAGTARHVVMRTSQSPITNLHLGNARGPVDEIRQALGEEIWFRAMAACESAADSFPGSHYIAVDLMISSNLASVAVAEVNAFGDLIPGVLSQGDDTYTAELRSLLETGENC